MTVADGCRLNWGYFDGRAVVQRKGKCGTDSAPRKCVRRQQMLMEASMMEQEVNAQLVAQRDQQIMEQLQLAAAAHEQAALAAQQ